MLYYVGKSEALANFDFIIFSVGPSMSMITQERVSRFSSNLTHGSLWSRTQWLLTFGHQGQTLGSKVTVKNPNLFNLYI